MKEDEEKKDRVDHFRAAHQRYKRTGPGRASEAIDFARFCDYDHVASAVAADVNAAAVSNVDARCTLRRRSELGLVRCRRCRGGTKGYRSGGGGDGDGDGDDDEDNNDDGVARRVRDDEGEGTATFGLSAVDRDNLVVALRRADDGASLDGEDGGIQPRSSSSKCYDGPALGLTTHPGFVFCPSALTERARLELARRALATYCERPAGRTNIDLIPPKAGEWEDDRSMWRTWKESRGFLDHSPESFSSPLSSSSSSLSTCRLPPDQGGPMPFSRRRKGTAVASHPESFSKSNCHGTNACSNDGGGGRCRRSMTSSRSGLARVDDGEGKCSGRPYRCFEKLSWSTLGYHYDWTDRAYREDQCSDMPRELVRLGEIFAPLCDFIDGSLVRARMADAEADADVAASTTEGRCQESKKKEEAEIDEEGERSKSGEENNARLVPAGNSRVDDGSGVNANADAERDGEITENCYSVFEGVEEGGERRRTHHRGRATLPPPPSSPSPPPFRAQAAIVNYYTLKSVMGGHRDDLELDLTRPVVSVSLGLPAIFLLGGASRTDADTPVLPILVRDGDVMIMGGKSRLCYHGVARVIDPKDDKDGVGEELTAASSEELAGDRTMGEDDGDGGISGAACACGPSSTCRDEHHVSRQVDYVGEPKAMEEEEEEKCWALRAFRSPSFAREKSKGDDGGEHDNDGIGGGGEHDNDGIGGGGEKGRSERGESERDLAAVRAYLSGHRINVNLRQVLPDGMERIP